MTSGREPHDRPLQPLSEPASAFREAAAADEPLPSLAPPVGLSRAETLQQLEPPPVYRPPKPPEPGFRFGIADILLFMVGAGVGLAGGSWMQADLYAAILGLLTLLGLIAVHLNPPQSPLLQRLWYFWVAAYLLAVVSAVLKGSQIAGN